MQRMPMLMHLRHSTLCAGHRPPIRRRLVLLFTLAASEVALGAGTPLLRNISPSGGQRGQEVMVNCAGARLSKTVGVLFHEPGITLVKLQEISDSHVVATLKIDPNCPVGPHRLRLHTVHGITELKIFSVGVLPEAQEVEPNSERAKPQTVKLPLTMNGMIAPEDVDYFSFEAAKGQTLSFEVEGTRLGDTLWDPRLAIYDASGNELAVADDTAITRQDPSLVVTIPENGTYTAEIRETAYGGSLVAFYRLHMGAFPRPLACLPAGGKMGSEVEVTWIGDPTVAKQKVTLPTTMPTTLPSTLPEGYAIAPQVGEAMPPTAVPFRLSHYESTVETEPNNDGAHANPIAVPGGVSGVINGERDIDFFAFDAKKGQIWECTVYARRLRSPLDAVIDVHRHTDAGLTGIGGNDDSAGPDSSLRFTAPEDGKYGFDIHDLLYKNGLEYSYYVEVTPVTPKLTLSIPRALVPEQARLAVAAGNRTAILFTANRSDFGGALNFSAAGLPPGVQVHVGTMHDNVNQIPIVFEAAPDAPMNSSLVDIMARHVDPNVNIYGHIRHAVDLIEVQAQQTVFSTIVEHLAVGVTAPVPFKITVVEPKVPIVRRGAMELPIKVERSADFKGVIEARLVWNPPGIGSGAVTIPADKTEAFIHLDANNGAVPGKWKFAVMATSDLEGGPFEVASQLATLEIADPFVDFEVATARTELGKPVEMAVKVSQKTPFEGEAKIDLLGLPPKVATTQTAVTNDTQELKYALDVPTSAPAGRHGGVFVRAIVMKDGEPIIHQSLGAELVLDTPLPPKDPKAEAERAEAKRKAEEAKAQKKAERIAAAAKRKAEREAAKQRADAAKPNASMPATQASASEN